MHNENIKTKYWSNHILWNNYIRRMWVGKIELVVKGSQSRSLWGVNPFQNHISTLGSRSSLTWVFKWDHSPRGQLDYSLEDRLNGTRDQTHILMDTSQVLNPQSHNWNSKLIILDVKLCLLKSPCAFSVLIGLRRTCLIIFNEHTAAPRKVIPCTLASHKHLCLLNGEFKHYIF